VTLTGLPPALEPHPVSVARRTEACKELGRRLGPGRVWWRYAPIVLGARLDEEFHVENFGRLARELAGSTSRVVLSLVDWYRKTTRRMARAESAAGPFARLDGRDPRALRLAERLAGIARKEGLSPFSCCEPGWDAVGIPAGACIDARAAADLFGLAVELTRDPGQRPHCRCAPSYDIGATNTCIGGCLYCYSVSDHKRAETANNRLTASQDSLT